MVKGRVRRSVVVLVCVLAVVGADLAVAQQALATPDSRAEGPFVPEGDPSGTADDVAPLRSDPGDGSDGPQQPVKASFATRPGTKPRNWDGDAEGYVDGSSKEVPDQTSETRQVFDNPDGTVTEQVSPEPVRFRGSGGGWQEFDTDLGGAAGGRLVPASAPDTDTVAAASSSTVALATVGTAAGSVSLVQPEARAATATVVDGDARYPDALPGGADLEVGLDPHGFESTVVVAAADDAANTYTERLSVPAGVRARQGGPGIELVDASGTVVGVYGSGTAIDSADRPVDVEVRTRLVGQAGTVVTVENSVDAGWLRSPDRVFPVRIDPSFSAGTGASGAIDTYVQSNISVTSQSAAATLKTGAVYGDTATLRRALMKFNLTGLVGSGRGVLTATLDLNVSYSPSCTARSLVIRSLAAAPTTSTVWSNQPAFGGTTITSPAFAKGYSSSCPAGVQKIDIASLVQKWVDGSTNNGLAVVAADEADGLGGKYFDSAEGATAPSLSVTYDRLPTNGALSSPASGAVLSTTQPRLQVTPGSDPDGDALQYWFNVTTDPDGQSGQVLSSGWLTTPYWDLPAGSLVDGQTYYWTASTFDGVYWPAPPPASRPFSIDLRLGDTGTWPTDEVGPAKVNLTNGNLVVGTSSPSFSTAGGDLGVSYSYNAKAEPTGGLTGSYYDLSFLPPASHTPSSSDQPELVRRDPVVSFNWGTGKPWSKLAADNYYAAWTGYLTAPTTGTYNLGAQCDDGARITLNGSVRLDSWSGCGTGSTWSASLGLTKGASLPIKVEYWEGTGSASVHLQAKGPGLATGGQDIPASWLSTVAPTLPTGWALSADIDGSVAYRSAQVTNTVVTFTDSEGTAHRYRWDAVKAAWQPPAGEHGVASTDGAGNVTLADEDGQTYSFGPDGNLESVESAADDRHPAAQQLSWSGSPAKLTAITDPVSNRSITLAYSGSSTCTADAAFSAAPPGMLCAVDYGDFGGGTSQLRYNAAGRLARIEDPGAEVTDFAYDAQSRLARLRDPLAADALAAGVRTDDASTNPTETVVAYDGSGRVSSVKLPEPQPGEARPAHTYAYPSATTTEVSAAGLTSTTGKLDQVTFDATGRAITDTDQAGRTTHTEWDAQDHQIATWDDATGLETTTVYDDLGDATDTWGPAPSSWWSSPSAGGAPTAANQPNTPHATAGYDQGLSTLGATWWDDNTFGGAPSAHSTGINPSTGLIYNSWGSGAPAELGTPAPSTFSGRISGWINIANTSPYDFRISSLVGTARLYVDNTLVIDDTETTSTNVEATFTPTSTGWKPVTIEFADTGSSASFGWWWRQGTASFVRVPQASLQPGYGLETTTTDPDGHVATTVYADPSHHIDPYLGIATSTTTDPGTGSHANLTGTVTVEDPTVGGYLRETGHTLPAGSASTVSSTYWGDTEAADLPCAGGATGVVQGGQLAAVTSADPDGTGPADPIVRETVYDRAGRPAASRVHSDGANWTCSTFDARGRTTKVTTPELTSAAGDVETTDHAVNGNPLATADTDTATGGSARTTTTLVDLLGRERSYTDAWGNTTTTAYDQVGRVTAVVSPVGTETSTYDATGAEGPTVLDGATLATPHYDGAGRLSWVDYANGTKSDPVARDALGRETGSTWRKSSDNSVLASGAETLTLAGDITGTTTDGNDPHPGAADYLYDGAGRLTEAWTTVRDGGGAVSSRHTAYGFGTASASCGSGTQSDAGKNTNRTSQTVGDGAAAVTTTSCYDSADRLVSTSEAGVGTPVYDGHGNTTTLWGEARGYDASDRHLSTTKGGTTVSYDRDGTDRIIQRTATVNAGPPDVERYGFTGDGDSPDLVMDATGAVVERDEALPGGVSVTMRAGSQVWSYPNLHGDVVVTTDAAGAKQGVTRTYDPYGNTTGQSLVDNSAGHLDYGWLGEHQRPVEHETGLAQTIEMGARQYDPDLGRFLEVDPIEGGSANDYDYVNADPINGLDLDGTWWHPSHIYRHVTRRVIHHWRRSRFGGHGRHHGLWHRSWRWVGSKRGTIAALSAGAACGFLTAGTVSFACAIAAGGAIGMISHRFSRHRRGWRGYIGAAWRGAGTGLTGRTLGAFGRGRYNAWRAWRPWRALL